MSHIDPSRISDPQVRELLVLLLNMVEEQAGLLEAQKVEIQALRDEINRLKGEQGKPTFPARRNKKPQSDTSSEQERKQAKSGNKKPKKRRKKTDIEIDHTVECKIDKSILPADAQYKGQEKIVQQDIVFARRNTAYMVDVYYSASEGKSYRASLPPSYQGQFGDSLKAFSLMLHNVCDVTGGKLHKLYQDIGLQISSGTISNILLGYKDIFVQERKEILHAGLSAEGSYVQIDGTMSRVKGESHVSQIMANDLFSTYFTSKGKSREEVLAALQGLSFEQLGYRYNSKALELMTKGPLKVGANDRVALAKTLSQDVVLNSHELDQLIEAEIPTLKAKKNIYKRVKQALALGCYYQQQDFPVVELLVSDDAPEYKHIATDAHALCWVHDARHYKKLMPRLEQHQAILEQFEQRYWQFYYRLLAYKEDPQAAEAQEIRAQFEQLFTPDTEYFQLNQRIEKTRANGSNLLAVLDYPQLPLHNNLAELAARRKVRKRDISLHTMSTAGTQNQDALLSVVETARKLGLNIYQYLKDRVSGKNSMTSLAELISLA